MIDPIDIPEFNKLSTSEETKESDRSTIDEFGIDGFTLMEIAASGAAKSIGNTEGKNKTGLYICGKGNNGGDAIATARYLNQDFNHSVKLVFVFGVSDLSPDSQKNLDLIKKLLPYNSEIDILGIDDDLPLNQCDYIVDGILGTGLNSHVREPISGIIETLNNSGLPLYSMDVPTGLHADSGNVMGNSIKADYTFTFGTNKTGFYLNSAHTYTGSVKFISLPFPKHLKKYSSILIDGHLELKIESSARKAKHKYEQGVVHIIAGSEGLTGAAIMAAQSAWKKGAGAVILYTPKKLLPIYEKNLPQIIKVAVGSDKDSFFKKDHADQIKASIAKKPGIVLAGPGIGSSEESKSCIYDILSSHNDYAVLDADALNGFEQLKSLPEENRMKWILTPHIGEAKQHLDLHFEDDYSRLNAASDFVKKYRCGIVMKGNPTIFIDTNGKQFITGYDTAMFTRAGFGDVLSGTIATNLGITREEVRSVADALYSGYKKYIQYSESGVFGPEHLL